MKMVFLLLLEQVAKIIKMLMRLWISFWQMLFLLANVIDRLEEYHKKENIPIDNNKRTSIVIQNPSLSSESMLNSNKTFCCL